MIRFVTSLLLTVVPTVASANAKCHKYSIWLYPYPQRCATYPIAPAPKILDPDPDANVNDSNDHSWYVEITKLPPDVDPNADREKGIDQLRDLLGHTNER